jgi:hypothetical protein
MAVTPPTITKRLVKQSPLTASEMDTNLGNLLDYTTDTETTFADGTGFVDDTVGQAKLVDMTEGQIIVGLTTTGVCTATTMSGAATLAGDGAITLADSGVHTESTPVQYDAGSKFTVNRAGQITAATAGTHHVSTLDPDDTTDGNDGDFWYKYYA